jgi:hypothetical protein
VDDSSNCAQTSETSPNRRLISSNVRPARPIGGLGPNDDVTHLLQMSRWRKRLCMTVLVCLGNVLRAQEASLASKTTCLEICRQRTTPSSCRSLPITATDLRRRYLRSRTLRRLRLDEEGRSSWEYRLSHAVEKIFRSNYYKIMMFVSARGMRGVFPCDVLQSFPACVALTRGFPGCPATSPPLRNCFL